MVKHTLTEKYEEWLEENIKSKIAAAVAAGSLVLGGATQVAKGTHNFEKPSHWTNQHMSVMNDALRAQNEGKGKEHINRLIKQRNMGHIMHHNGKYLSVNTKTK